MRKILIVVAISLFFVACNSSNDETCTDNSGLVGTWELIDEEGYELYSGNRDEWSEKSADYDETYTFNCGGIGKHIGIEHFEGGETSTAEIEWQYNSTSRSLEVVFTDAGDISVFTVIEISSTNLVLEAHNIDGEYEYYNKATYIKK